MSTLVVQADAGRIPLGDRSVDLVIGSPPYLDARKYLEGGVDLKIARGVRAWVDWMVAMTEEALRVSRGAVIWVAAGKTKARNYQPACEGLMWEWFLKGGECHQYRPCYWRRVGIAGSGGDQWFRSDVEYCLCFKRPGKLPWADNTAMGHPPKWGPGGSMSHRVSDGTRVNQWGKTGTDTGTRQLEDGVVRHGKARPSHVSATIKEYHQPGGKKEKQGYVPPKIANPGNLIDIKVGGGLMGSKLAHENEAPFPEDLAEWFIRSLAPPGGLVLDVFSGSGTVAAVADRLGRHGIGADLRRSQCDLGVRRVADGLLRAAEAAERRDRPHKPRRRRPPPADREPTAGRDLPGQQLLF